LQRASEQSSEKVRIGQAAADLIHDGETVFLSSGTTVLEVARRLQGKHNLTVITNSLLVVSELANANDITVISLGGILRHSEMSLIGHITELALSELRADKVILGIRAIDPDNGLTSGYVPETMTDRAILKIGREVIVVADHTKCGASATAFVAPITSVHTLITDAGTPKDFIAAVQAQGVKVMVV
jgi:DeoR/GlpR family transcriptional regulator of sugar metabolism